MKPAICIRTCFLDHRRSFFGRGELTSEYSVTWVRVPVRVKVRVGVGALFGHCSSCGFSSSFASLGRFYEFERSPLCAGTGDDPKGHAGD